LNLGTPLALENTVVNVCTTCSRVKESEFPSHTVLMCFTWFLQYSQIISVHSSATFWT